MDTRIITQIKELYADILEEKLIAEILAIGKVRTYAEDEIIIDINEAIQQIPLMLSGSIKIMREDSEGHELFLYYIEAGSTCAASLTCCMNNHRSNILAAVEEEATFVSIPVQQMEEWMGKYPSWRKFILHSYARRYDELLEVVDLLAFKKMDDRVFNYLKENAALHQSAVVHASHQKIAFDLNSSREVVSRILKQMERKGLLTLKRGQILMHQKHE